MESNEKGKGTFTTVPQFEIIEIDETIIKNEPILSNRKICSEVYFNSIEENCLKCVCITCNDSQSSLDEMFRHINENKDTCGNIYFENYEKLFTSGEKFGEVFIKENYETEFLCIMCNKILHNKNIIFTHLTQHLNNYKKTKIENNDLSHTSGTLQFRKKFVDIYLAENPNHNFLYACSTCDFKDMKFNSMCNHLEQQKQTCGNFDINIKVEIETNKDDSFGKTCSKVCEVYMDSERKAYFMCLCCNKYYSEQKLVSEHLLVHLNNKKLAKSTKTSDSGLKIIAAESIATTFEEVLHSSKLVFQTTKKSNEPLRRKSKYKRDHYECKICSKILCTLYYLKCHLRRAHSILFTNSFHLRELPNFSLEELMKFKINNDEVDLTNTTDEDSSSDNESNSVQLLEFCSKPLQKFLTPLPDLYESPVELKETSRKNYKTYKNLNISKIKNITQYHLKIVTEDDQIPKYQIDEIGNVLVNNFKSSPKSDISNLKVNDSKPTSKNKFILNEVKKKLKCKYKCNVCHKILTSKYILRDHLWRMHNIDEMLNIECYTIENDNSDLIELSSDSSFSDGNASCAKTINEYKGKKKPSFRVNPYLLERKIKGRYGTDFNDLMCNTKIFEENFHMSVDMFNSLFSMLENLLKPKRNTRLKDCIPPKQKLAMVLEYFASEDLQAQIASVYRVSKQHFGSIIDLVCNAILKVLKPKMQELNKNFFLEVANEFNSQWNFPNCIGAIDGKHVMLKAPSNSLYNSIVIWAVSDASYRFIYLDVRTHGSESENEENIFWTSQFGKDVLNDDQDFPENGLIDNENWPFFYIGDDAFPLCKRIMKPYNTKKLSDEERIFNYRLNIAHRCIENAFGILYTKWLCLTKTFFCQPDRAQKIISACCLLHNYLIYNDKTTYCPSFYADSIDSNGNLQEGEWRKRIAQNSLCSTSHLSYCVKDASFLLHETTEYAKFVRNKIKKYVNTTGAVPWQRKAAL